MSLQALTKVLEQDDLSSPAKFVLLILANYANEDGESYPSVGNIAKKTSLAERSVRRLLLTLEEQNLVRRIPRFVDGQQRSNVYRINISGLTDGQGGLTQGQGGGDSVSGWGMTDSHPDTKELDTKEDTNTSAKPKKGVRAVKKQPSSIPDDFEITPEMRAWADRAVPTLDIDYELPRFIDRCLAKGTVYADWTAGWRTQMKNAIEWGQGKLKEKSAAQQPVPDDGHRIDYSWLMLAQRNHPNQDWFTDRERYETAKADWLNQYELRPDVYELCLKEVAEYESGSEFAERFPK